MLSRRASLNDRSEISAAKRACLRAEKIGRLGPLLKVLAMLDYEVNTKTCFSTWCRRSRARHVGQQNGQKVRIDREEHSKSIWYMNGEEAKSSSYHGGWSQRPTQKEAGG